MSRATIRRLRRRLARTRDEAVLHFALPRRSTPVSRSFGVERGGPIDRHYIEAFMERYRADVRGSVLEAGGFVNYTRQFGGDRVTRGEVLYPKAGFPDGTIVGDLATGEGLPSESFDCVILTQVLLCIYDLPAAVAHCHRILRPGGVVLATVPGISQIAHYDRDNWGDFWRFTDAGAARLFGDVFGSENVRVETYGNVLAACAFLMGLSVRDLTTEELVHHDPEYQLSIAIRAVRPPKDAVVPQDATTTAPASPRPPPKEPRPPGSVPK